MKKSPSGVTVKDANGFSFYDFDIFDKLSVT